MSGIRGVMNNGWHPKGKDGKKESWRGDFKGINQVAGWVGKGKNPDADDRSDHVARPLSSLKDPNSFGPPPKRTGTGTGIGYGAGASAGSPSSTTSSTIPARTTPRRGLGAPLAPEEIVQHQTQDEQEEQPAAPPLPYRANRTGLNTDRLPPPPVRRTESPISSTPTSQSRPNLPPRLPARNAPSNSPSPPPPPYTETDHSIQMNQGSVSRLENAGVSVPALGIGRRDSDHSATAQRGINSQVNELQSRFAKMNTPGSQSPDDSSAEASRPEQNTYNNGSYSPVSRTDTRSARPSPPANNFRQRSSEHIETGKQKLAAFNQKHKITDRIHSYFEPQPAEASPQQGQAPPPPPHPNLSRQSSNIDMEVLNRRKAPPPPPPAKKASLKSTPVSNNSSGASNNNNSGSAPPPLPLGTKPR